MPNPFLDSVGTFAPSNVPLGGSPPPLGGSPPLGGGVPQMATVPRPMAQPQTTRFEVVGIPDFADLNTKVYVDLDPALGQIVGGELATVVESKSPLDASSAKFYANKGQLVPVEGGSNALAGV